MYMDVSRKNCLKIAGAVVAITGNITEDDNGSPGYKRNSDNVLLMSWEKKHVTWELSP